MVVVAGAVMLVFGLALDWATIDAAGRSFTALDAFDYPFTGGIAWFLTVASGIVTFLVASGLVAHDRVPWTRLFVSATMVATVLMLLRLALGGGSDERIGNLQVTLGRGAGMYVALLAAGLAFAGAALNLHAEGGSLRDIFSADAWSRSTQRGEREPLPPPAPGASPREPPSHPRP